MTSLKLWLLGLAVPLALAAVAPVTMTTAGGNAPLTCAIETTPVAGGVRVEAVATAKADVAGTYRLNVGGGADGNSNTIAQGGEFTVTAGERSVLSSVMLGGGAGNDFTASLTVEWPGGHASCRASGPSST